MKIIIQTIFLIFCANGLSAQPQKFYYIGHSLINLNIPFMVQQLADAANKPANYRHHINIGAPLILNWSEPSKFNGDLHWIAAQNREVEHGTNFLLELANTGYTALVMTEAQGFPSNFQWNNSILYGQKFDSVARKANPLIKTYCYETWDEVDSNNNFAIWRQNINRDSALWRQMAKGIRPDGLIVPGGQAMAALYDALQQGAVGRLTNINQVFTDKIHLTNTGNYYIALVMYATLFRTSPEGLPAVGAGPFIQNTMVETDAPTRLALQRLAWQTVRNYPLSGALVSVKDANINKMTTYPNPVDSQIFLENTVEARNPDAFGKGVHSIELYDLQGRLIKQFPVQQVLDIAYLPSGMYLLLIKNKGNPYTLKICKM
jgi:Secretion system C-terminal sorting domain